MIFKKLFHVFRRHGTPPQGDAFWRTAKEIAGTGDYEKIRAELLSRRFMKTCVKKVHSLYGEKFACSGFRPAKEDWEMFAILWLYHEDTAEHGLRTLLLANELLSSPLRGPADEKIFLKNLLLKNGIALPQFLRSALFHDVGKIALPREVVENSLNDKEMGNILLQMLAHGDRNAILESLEIDPGTLINDKDVLRKIYRRGLRPKDAVPAKEIFTGASASVLGALEKRGFSVDNTLGQILSRHESEGQKIFEKKNRIVANIIGHHHPGVKLPTKKRAGIVPPEGDRRTNYRPQFLLALIDESDAIEYARSYKPARSKKEVLYRLAEDAEGGRLDRGLTYLWLSNRPKETGADPDDKIFDAHIEAFLSDPQNREAAAALIQTIR